MSEPINLFSPAIYTNTILIVDDDAEIRDLLRTLLSKHGFVVFEAENGKEMFRIMKQKSIDIILLDIMLEDSDGIEICKQIRKNSSIPLIMISAMSEPTDRVLGLEFGADDYITKPFYSREVVARIKSLLRRMNPSSQEEKIQHTQKAIRFAGWTLYRDSRRLFDPNMVEVSLSVGEYILLEALIENARKIITRDQLLSYIHTYHEQEVFDRSIDVQICRLRKRVENNAKNPTLIKTVRGEGYILDATIEKVMINNAAL
jgi:two-component system OmpR family response regulator